MSFPDSRLKTQAILDLLSKEDLAVLQEKTTTDCLLNQYQ